MSSIFAFSVNFLIYKIILNYILMFLKLNDSEIKCLLLFGPALCQEKKTHTMYDYISK